MALRHAAAAAAAAGRLSGLQPRAVAAARFGGIHSKARLSTSVEEDARQSTTVEEDATLRALETKYVLQIEKTKEALYDLMAVANRHRLICGLRRLEYAELFHLLSVNVVPRPHDPHWRRVKTMQMIRDYVNLAGACCLGITVATVWDWYVKAAQVEEARKQYARPLEYDRLYEELLHK